MRRSALGRVLTVPDRPTPAIHLLVEIASKQTLALRDMQRRAGSDSRTSVFVRPLSGIAPSRSDRFIFGQLIAHFLQTLRQLRRLVCLGAAPAEQLGLRQHHLAKGTLYLTRSRDAKSKRTMPQWLTTVNGVFGCATTSMQIDQCCGSNFTLEVIVPLDILCLIL